MNLPSSSLPINQAARITLTSIAPIAAGIVPIVTYKPSKDRPVITMTAVTSDQALPGFVAVFTDEEWPKHVLYTVDSEAEARMLAEADLAMLALPGRYLTKSSLDRYYWTVNSGGLTAIIT